MTFFIIFTSKFTLLKCENKMKKEKKRLIIDNNYKIKKGELNKIKHLEGLQYWEFCLIVIKCSNATTTTTTKNLHI